MKTAVLEKVNITRYSFSKEKHLHTLDGRPLTGTSSIGKIFGDPNPLMWYASGKAVEQFGWLNSKKATTKERLESAKKIFDYIKDTSVEDYLAMLDKAYKAHNTHKEKKAKEGVNLHEVLERFVKTEMGKKVEELSKEENELIKPFIDWSRKEVKKFIASEANCYSEKLWLGGQLDALCELNDGKFAIIDFKSAKGAYPSMFVQTALYTFQVEENGLFDETGTNNKKLNKPIEALIIVPFGAPIVTAEIRYNVEDWKQGALSALNLYRLLGIEENNKNY